MWEAAKSRWRQVDAQIDAVQRKKHTIDFDTLDLPAGKFFTAAQTWALCRANKAKSGTFGRNRKMRGWKFIRTSLLLELAALNKIELLPVGPTGGTWLPARKTARSPRTASCSTRSPRRSTAWTAASTR